jgi:DNA primase
MDRKQGESMIDRSGLPRISDILSRLRVPPGRRGRTCCPIHQGDNPQAFSYDDEKGQWYCFRCGLGGDAVELVKKSLDVNFKEALQWLDIAPGTSSILDPESLRRKKVRDGLRKWAHTTARELRFEHYLRIRVIEAAKRRLKRDEEDEWAWNWLAWAYTGLEAIAYKLDMLEGSEEEQIEIYRHIRRAA